MTADVLVLGAGIVGVSTALALAERGMHVILADNTGPEAAASFGNSGILQAEAVEPYAMPRAPMVLLRMLLGRDNGFDPDWRGIVQGLGPLLSYYRHSAPKRHDAISRLYAGLVAEAVAAHSDFAGRAGATHLLRNGGYLAVTRQPARFAAMAVDAVRIAAHFGVPSEAVDARALQQMEPALAQVGGGAIHWQTPVCVDDPGGLVAAYQSAFVAMGGQRDSADARDLRQTHDAWEVPTPAGTARARRVVLALGAATPAIARRYGHRFPQVAKRGYHQEFSARHRPERPVLDADNGIVLAPMRGLVRLTTGASLRPFPAPMPRQIMRGRQLAEELLGCPLVPVSGVWSGLRPCMPDMLPVLGQSAKQKGLWFHFGHGHQGLTLGPATARLLARQILDEPGEGKMRAALSPDRFG